MPVRYYLQDCGYVLRGKRATAQWIERVARCEGKTVGDIAVVFCSDAVLLNINRQYLGHDYLTDIITFDNSAGKILAGDLMISLDTVRANARSFEVSFREELMRVIIHGILHLCGHGDKSPQEQTRMRQLEDNYLKIR